MIKIERTEVYNVEGALRGARNPLKSWAKSDSRVENGVFVLGGADADLLDRLCRAGSDHRKFLRQITVSADVTAPLYWWKEFDTYKVGITANSTSTMHKLHTEPITEADFSTDRLDADGRAEMARLVAFLERERQKFSEGGDKAHWWNMIQLLPSSYNQLRTLAMSYENVRSIYYARRAHKLDEWRVFCAWAEGLPHADIFLSA